MMPSPFFSSSSINETQSRTLILQNQSIVEWNVGLHVKDSLLNLLTFLGLEARRNPQKALTMIVLHQLQVCINIPSFISLANLY